MKPLSVILLFASSALVLADPGPEAIAFLKVSGGTQIPCKREPFDKSKFPEALAAIIPNVVMDGDEGKPVAPHEGFTFDINKDGRDEYFIFESHASGSGGHAYSIYAEIEGTWARIMNFQGSIHVLPKDKGWPRLVYTCRGGGSNHTKVYSNFNGKKYENAMIERYDSGKITKETPRKSDWTA